MTPEEHAQQVKKITTRIKRLRTASKKPIALAQKLEKLARIKGLEAERRDFMLNFFELTRQD